MLCDAVTRDGWMTSSRYPTSRLPLFRVLVIRRSERIRQTSAHSFKDCYSQLCLLQLSLISSAHAHTSTFIVNRSIMLENFTKKIVNSLLGSDEGGEDEPLDRQTAHIESGGAHIRPDIDSHWASAMADLIQVSGCSCIWCRRNSESNGDSKVERGQPIQSPHPRIRPRKVRDSPMATTSGVLEVLYPPSYLNTPPALDPEASPPAYDLPPTIPPNTPQIQSTLISSREGRDYIPCTPRLPQLTPESVPSLSTEPLSAYRLPDTSLDVTVPSAQPPHCRSSPRIVQQPIIGLGLEHPTETDDGELPAYSRFDPSRPRFPAASDTLGPYPHISLLSPNLG